MTRDTSLEMTQIDGTHPLQTLKRQTLACGCDIRKFKRIWKRCLDSTLDIDEVQTSKLERWTVLLSSLELVSIK